MNTVNDYFLVNEALVRFAHYNSDTGALMQTINGGSTIIHSLIHKHDIGNWIASNDLFVPKKETVRTCAPEFYHEVQRRKALQQQENMPAAAPIISPDMPAHIKDHW